MPEQPETFAQVGAKDQIRNEIWRLTDRMGDSLRSIIFADDDADIDVGSLLAQSLKEFSKELKSRFPHWAKGEAVEKHVVVRHNVQSIAKVDDEQQIVFGWFNVVTKADGAELIDLHDDIIDPEVLEKAAYEFVLESREGGVLHQGDAQATLVESMVFTPDKIAAMVAKGAGAVGINVPPGWWWGGFKVHNEDVFALVKSGDYSMFSIEGTATREKVAA